MKRYRVTSEHLGITYLTWAHSARNAIFAHRLHHADFAGGNVTAIEVK